MLTTHHDIIAGHDVSLVLKVREVLGGWKRRWEGRTLTDGGVVVKKGRKGRGTGFIGSGSDGKIMMALFSRHTRGFREAFGGLFSP